MSLARLSALDDAFLAVESPTAHMHVGWVTLFDPPDGGPRPSAAELYRHIELRLGRSRRFRQRIRRMPLGLGAPTWVDDPDFDLSRHLSRACADRISDVVDSFYSEPLPQDRPLWQMRICDRLGDGRIGVVGKAHHCMVDGIAAVELASLLVDVDADPPDPAPDRWRPSPAPGALGLLASAAEEVMRGPREVARLAGQVARGPRKALDHAGAAARALADAARPARASQALNQPISGLRHLGMLARPIDDLLELKRAYGVTLNDVVLAVCAGAVRAFLRQRGEDPLPMKAMVPANVRGDAGAGELGNRLSFIFVDLPCDEPDPARRLRDLHLATSLCKRSGEIEGGTQVLRTLALAPSPVRRLASHLLASPRAFNLVVSNIPGPREPLYMRGCRLAEAYPVVPIADRHGLSIGVTTVADGAFFGVYTDRRSLPDADAIVDQLDRDLDDLAASAPTPAREDTPAIWPPAFA